MVCRGSHDIAAGSESRIAKALKEDTPRSCLRGEDVTVAGQRALTVSELVVSACEQLDRPLPLLTPPGTLPADHPASVFAPYFDVIVTSEDVESYKPNAPIYQKALESLGAPAERTLFVSDSAQDLRGAAALGMAGVRPVDGRVDGCGLRHDARHGRTPR